jgi:hypothetical protein
MTFNAPFLKNRPHFLLEVNNSRQADLMQDQNKEVKDIFNGHNFSLLLQE